MTWTKEALERLDRIPGFVVGMATGAIIRYAIEKGYTVITTGVIDEVIKSILPPGAMESMRAIGDQMREAEAMGEDKPIDSLFKDFDERTADKANGTNGHKNSANGSDAAAKQEIFEAGRGGFGKSEDQGDIEGISAEVREEIQRSAQGQDRFECDVCRYVAKGKPAKCPVCGSGPVHFHAVDAEIATTSGNENLNLSEIYDGRELHWTDEATALLDSLEEWQEKRRVKARVEKSALKKGYTTITQEYVEQQYREETGREAPEVKSGGCPVSHAKQEVQETSGAKCPIDHSAFQKAGASVPEGGSREFVWTEDAIERLERAPKGFMRNISRNMTEKLARERGTAHIDLSLVEDSLTGARTTMEDVITGKVSIADLAKDTGENIEAEDGEAPHPPMTVTMVCTTCGEELQGIQPPEECPVCGAPGEDFEQR
jgi:rubrerythrin